MQCTVMLYLPSLVVAGDSPAEVSQEAALDWWSAFSSCQTKRGEVGRQLGGCGPGVGCRWLPLGVGNNVGGTEGRLMVASCLYTFSL